MTSSHAGQFLLVSVGLCGFHTSSWHSLFSIKGALHTASIHLPHFVHSFLVGGGSLGDEVTELFREHDAAQLVGAHI